MLIWNIGRSFDCNFFFGGIFKGPVRLALFKSGILSYSSYNAALIDAHALVNRRRLDQCNSLFRNLPELDHCSVFKIALLVYKFLQSGYPKYCEPMYNTLRSQANGVVLRVPHLATSLYKSTKHSPFISLWC